MSTKFMVIKLRELVKTVAFAALGIILIFALIHFLVPKMGKTAIYTPGTYTSDITLGGESLGVKVTVTKRKIKAIDLVPTAETMPVFYPLLSSTAENVAKQIVKTQSVTDIEIPSDAYVTAQVVINAVNESLETARLEPAP